ncbi:hypothetical protein TYRP_015527 [Tyrophagus putrescentiae]|nr:hypothetical protein TYRP_015527 [Tyrophagus putrescentiae]
MQMNASENDDNNNSWSTTEEEEDNARKRRRNQHHQHHHHQNHYLHHPQFKASSSSSSPPPPHLLRMITFSSLFLLSLISLLLLLQPAAGQCPWPRNPQHASLHSDCVCGYSNVRRLSVQCSPVANFSLLLAVLHSTSVRRLPIDLLYINNATDRGGPGGAKSALFLPKNAFRGLDIQQIHLANSRLEAVERGAFAGLEEKLLSLTLQGTGLRELPATEFKTLRSLRTLDLSGNRLKRIRAHTFAELGQLATLRLAFNADLQLDVDAFAGLERSLKNLNLKAIGAKTNEIEEVPPKRFYFAHLHSLTALCRWSGTACSGCPVTPSSLSLLNNALVEAPVRALEKLTGLRVLDLGFNAIRHLPPNAFRSNTLLTLLALDGNPLRTLPLATFAHLNQTLRGLSVGGKAFECDCKVRWLAEWAQAYSLQITSRERNPQFCAKPAHLRAKQPFTHVDLNDFVCPPGTSEASALVPSSIPTTSTTSTTTKSPKSHSHHHSLLPEVHYEPSAEVVVQSTTTTTKQPSIITSSTKPTVVYRPSPSPSPSPPATSYVQVVTVDEPEESEQESSEQAKNVVPNSSSTTTSTTTITSTSTLASSSKAPKVVNQKISSSSSKAETSAEQTMIKTNNKGRHRVPQSSSPSNIITQQQQSSTITPTTTTTTSQLRLLEATYRNNSISLRWEHPGGPRRDSSNLGGGYQVLYRYFGSKEYHRSEGVIPATATSYTLPEYIAPNELIVICVVSLDEVHSANLMESSNSNTDSSIPIAQCREINTKDQPPSSPPPIIKKGSSGVRPSLTTGSTSSTTSATSFSSLYPSLKRLNDLDKLVIAVSAAVCLFIVLAVLIFSCCFYRSVSKDHVRRQPSLRAVLAATNAAHCPLSVTSKSLSPMTKSSSLGGHGGNAPRCPLICGCPRPPPVPPPVITGTIRSHISAHQNQNGGGHPIRSTYFGSTLPNSAKVRNAGGAGGSSWVLNHDPLNTTAFYPANPAAVSYGTTVTANGGGGGPYSFDNAYLRNSSSLGRELLSPPPPIEASVYHQPQPNSYRSGRYQGNNSSSSSSNTAAAAVHNSRSNHRSRKSTSKGRSSKNGSHHHHHQPPMVTLPELRIHHHHQNASAGVNSGSYNRLLLSSSSNSFQSANTTEYYDDSDHWNSNSGGGGSNNNGYGRSLGNGTATTNSRMNDNEVDIYVDQNYARRFI